VGAGHDELIGVARGEEPNRGDAALLGSAAGLSTRVSEVEVCLGERHRLFEVEGGDGSESTLTEVWVLLHIQFEAHRQRRHGLRRTTVGARVDGGDGKVRQPIGQAMRGPLAVVGERSTLVR